MTKHLTFFFVTVFLAVAMMMPEKLNLVTKEILEVILSKFGWIYLLVGFLILCSCFYLMIGKYSSLTLGKDGDKPTYTYLSWLSMLFAAGMGIGLVFYGVAEPLSHYKKPPLGLANAETPESAILALRYTFFHWCLHPWAIYGFLGLCIAYYRFRLDRKYLISQLFSTRRISKLYSQGIDALSMTGVAFGVATSLGLGSLQIHAGLHGLFDYPLGIEFTIGLIAVTTFLYLTSALTGLDRGIRILSNTNLILAIILLISVFFLGPTNFLVEIFFSSIGSYLQNFISMSFRMAPFSDSTWLTKWTFFYWAWWISWAPFVATFIARISKGRTIREYLLGVMIVPSLLSAFWFSVLGGTAIYLERFKGIQIINNANQEITSVLFDTLEHLPFGEILSFFSIILILVFFVTSADSATFVLGMFSSEGDPDPNVKTKIIWGSFVSILASALLYLGGLEALQTIAIIISFPFTLLLFFLIWSFFKDLKEESKFSK